jgi:AcrR family transcriptional regulator
MIDAAERLVAEHGLAAMSLREVQKAAGQRNKSAAQYHFGSRTGLIEAIVASRMGPINEVRFERLAAVDAAPGAPALRDLAAVMVEPLAEATLRPGSCWARFLRQSYADPEVSDEVARAASGRGFWATRERLVEAASHLPEALRARRVDHAVGLTLISLATAEAHLARHGSTAVPTAAVTADLVDVFAAVIEAPASSSTLAALDQGAARSA